MNNKQFILNQFVACYNRDTWFVSLKTALDGITSEQASYKMENTVHSISEIVHHLYFYNLLELNRFREIPDLVSVTDNKKTFTDSEEIGWELLVEKIFTTFREWKREIEYCEEDYVEKFLESLYYINLHNAYHIGQIVQVRKNLGIWDENKGINYTI
ncbi:DinB family protein [Gracilibacillus sp. HCP3S3_G5_1]|uniref:DinB family protein n=1 Tax=unclassified Gracilibacillus TaxID=2625209 RepID=UPI003F8A589E